jgi:hypothetical protein
MGGIFMVISLRRTALDCRRPGGDLNHPFKSCGDLSNLQEKKLGEVIRDTQDLFLEVYQAATLTRLLFQAIFYQTDF